MRRDNTTFNASLEDGLRLPLRVGIVMGGVVVADSSITGDGMVLAQRLEQTTEPGGLLSKEPLTRLSRNAFRLPMKTSESSHS